MSHYHHHHIVVVVVVGATLFKNGQKLRRFKTNRGEIRQDDSSSEYALISGVDVILSRWRPAERV